MLIDTSSMSQPALNYAVGNYEFDRGGIANKTIEETHKNLEDWLVPKDNDSPAPKFTINGRELAFDTGTLGRQVYGALRDSIKTELVDQCHMNADAAEEAADKIVMDIANSEIKSLGAEGLYQGLTFGNTDPHIKHDVTSAAGHPPSINITVNDERFVMVELKSQMDVTTKSLVLPKTLKEAKDLETAWTPDHEIKSAKKRAQVDRVREEIVKTKPNESNAVSLAK